MVRITYLNCYKLLILLDADSNQTGLTDDFEPFIE